MKRIFFLIIILPFLVSCNNKTKKESEERIITVTIEPLRYFTEAIAGDKFTVVSMVPKGLSPETYDPTPRQLVSLGESEAYFRIGYIGFETSWMDRLIQNNQHLQVFDTSKGVELIRSQGHYHGDHFHAGGVEPHIWNSTVNGRIIAGNILDALCKLDKENELFYRERHSALLQVINDTDETIRNLLKGDADHAFMIYHPALTYFARDYNLHQICIEEEGKEPSAAHLKSLIEVSKFEEVKVIFIQPEFDQRNAELIAKQTGTKVVPINPLAYEWVEEMIHTARSLTHE